MPTLLAKAGLQISTGNYQRALVRARRNTLFDISLVIYTLIYDTDPPDAVDGYNVALSMQQEHMSDAGALPLGVVDFREYETVFAASSWILSLTTSGKVIIPGSIVIPFPKGFRVPQIAFIVDALSSQTQEVICEVYYEPVGVNDREYAYAVAQTMAELPRTAELGA